MPTAISALELTKAYSSHTLFSGVTLQLVDDDRLGLIGPNGAGKSTLLKILAGLETPDAGEVTSRRSLRRVYVPQDDEFAEGATPMSAVVAELARAGGREERLDEETRASITLSKLGFTDFDRPVAELSGGWRKRLSIARALVHDPEVLMLDEPTNHLDLEGILWLERFVQQARMGLAFVTHDRRFLENTVRRIVELSPAYPGGTFEVAGNYTEFVRRKAAFLDAQAATQAMLANKVARDTAWLLQGIQGRQTRNKTQVVDAADRRAELKAVRDRNAAPDQKTTIDFQATERKTMKLMTLHAVSKSMGGRPLFDSIDLMLSPGRRIGLLGPNGSGKTTLLRLLNGELEPDSGTIKRAAELRVVAFSQHRCQLDATRTLQEALCPVGDRVEYRGRSVHVSGWAGRFLFEPSQLSTHVGNLSGGEQARVLIAQLMLEPADVLLLDEPTNDLDIPSLEVLEDALLDFPGAIVIVSHDRFMLERISTEFLALDGQGSARGHASMEHWERAHTRRLDEERQASKLDRKASGSPASSNLASKPSSKPSSKPKRLSWKDQRDLESIEQRILEAEAEVERLETESADAAVIADHVRHAEVYRQLTEAQQRVRDLYDRWAELEAMQQA